MNYIMILSLITNLVFGFMVYRLWKAVDLYQLNEIEYNSFYNELQNKLKSVLSDIRDADIRGSFESDDEVGGAFETIKELIEQLETYQLDITDET